MSGMAHLITRVYGLLLRLYPRQFRVEFGDEMQSVFANAVNDAARRGLTPVLMVCAREMWELPRNVVREHWRSLQKENGRMDDTAALDDHPSSWLGTLIGAFPFLLFGPITVLLAYPYPYPAWRTPGEFVALARSIIYPLVMLIGLAAGWRARWPRWSFPYLCVSILLLDHWIAQSGGGLAQSVVPRVFGLEQEWPLFGQFVQSLAFYVLVPVAVLMLMRTIGWLRPLYLRIRQDWTQLSFGLSVVSALMLSGVDYDEDPQLTLAVILPGVIVLLSAVAHLRSTNKIQRVLSLLLGLLMAVAVSIWRHWYYILYGMFLAGIVFLPALLELSRPQSKTMLAE
jgi:hypothetical protein